MANVDDLKDSDGYIKDVQNIYIKDKDNTNIDLLQQLNQSVSNYADYMSRIQSDWSANDQDNIIGKFKQILNFMNFSPDFYLKDPDTPTSDKVSIDDPNFAQVLNLLDEHYIDMCNLYYTINASK